MGFGHHLFEALDDVRVLAATSFVSPMSVARSYSSVLPVIIGMRIAFQFFARTACLVPCS